MGPAGRQDSGRGHTRKPGKATGGTRVECFQEWCPMQAMLQPRATVMSTWRSPRLRKSQPCELG